MTTPLDGTVALVTGASSGIGEQTAATLAQLGAAVVVAAVRAGSGGYNASKHAMGAFGEALRMDHHLRGDRSPPGRDQRGADPADRTAAVNGVAE